VLRKSLTAVFSVAVLLALTGNALALVRTAKAPTTAKKKVVSNLTVTGPSVKAHQWGFMEVQLKVQKTVVTDGTKSTVTIKVVSITWPVYPDHTPKSKYINAQALPLLQQESMALQANAGSKLQNISGATHTSVAWQTSIQGALAKALTP
jgi:uncharacterized protein with FMN-binding domain